MKRTTEIVLSVIAVVLSGLTAIIGLMFNSMMADDEFRQMMESDEFRQSMEQELGSNPNLEAADLDTINSIFALVGPSLLIVGILSLVLGIIGIIAIKGNKKPILAGVMLILAALVIGIGTIGFGLIPAILYLIAGIMSLVRKPQVGL
ncbi:DUF4064 domain-containing protein [Sutcliffiella rhizosphaerae]|uniref:DUF4064 domain-containing protein n=1 Tax=Sutcliffiella rhizosphaerae TaxID=2880967 RepID=A0ABM8YMZ4_9BACI|nr:DUF4064 domain-containing protein [Sutcliffiella rhizosphaerae]CAG9621111.1 hypothetical protein BACCIP111883_01883 [Sutcliffiella rhizosphaerae]